MTKLQTDRVCANYQKTTNSNMKPLKVQRPEDPGTPLTDLFNELFAEWPILQIKKPQHDND